MLKDGTYRPQSKFGATVTEAEVERTAEEILLEGRKEKMKIAPRTSP
jgi:hypothetical protein